MVLNLAQLNTYYVILLPLIVSFVAGVLRQDKLPRMVNEGISYGVALILSVLQAFFGDKLGGSVLADFGIVAAYTFAMLHSPLFQKLQQTIQTKVASAGPAPQAADPLYVELQTILVSLLNNHLQGVSGLLQQFLQGLATQQVSAPTAPQAQPVRQIPFPDSPSVPMAALSSSQVQQKP